MNTFILMAKVVRSPELRYTQENQRPVAEMLVEFEAVKAEDSPSTLKVVGWGNLATEIQEKYSEGDRLIIEGRLSMILLERPEGFKEKRAELVASRVYSLDGTSITSVASAQSATSSPSEKVVAMDSYKSSKPASESTDFSMSSDFSPLSEPAAEVTDQNLDDIPF